MEFQQGMTLIVAAVSGGIGAVASYAVTKTKVEFLQEGLKELKDSVIFKDTCSQCQNKWGNHVDDLKEDIGEIKTKIEQILLRVSK